MRRNGLKSIPSARAVPDSASTDGSMPPTMIFS